MHAASSPMEPLNKNILLAGEVIAEKWKIGEKIGEGTFSQIYSAYSIESRDKVAVKVEAPSSLKPVLEWESLILKSLQDCPYVCRYYYHGKHGDSTVLVMELLGDSMSMLRMSPDSIHGVPLAKSVSVGLEMLDCIEAFHRHGYVHRDIKASNFALSAILERNPMKRQRYYIIDFGLSRQHLGEDRKVLPARQVAEFRGTSMYASLSSHRRQELGPKDDLWSWFYLVMDFMRGELPWAADAQLKNRQTVLRLKEHFTETNPSLLVEGLPGAAELLEMMDYLQSLKYEDLPDYGKIRKQLQAVGESSLVSENSDSGDEETSADKKEALAVAAVSAIDWSAIESERERALQWAAKADEQKNSDGASDMLLTIAKRYNTFFDSEGLSFDERIKVQSAVYRIEKKSRVRSSFLAPPPIQSFVKRRQSEQKMRSDALRKRRERDFQVRQSLELKNEQQLALAAAAQGVTEAAHGSSNGNGALDAQNVAQGAVLRPVKTESSMEVSDNEDTGANRSEQSAVDAAAVADSQVHGSSASMLQHQMPPMSAPISTGPPPQRWDRTASHGVPVPPPPPPPPGLPLSVQRSGAYAHPPPPPPPPPAGRYPPNGGIPPPPPGFPPTGRQHGAMTLPPPPPPVRSANYEPSYASGSDRHFDAPGKSEEDPIYSYQRSHRSPRDIAGSEAREDRGYASQRPQKSPRDSASGSHYDASRETRDSRGYYQRAQKPPRESVSDRFLDDPVEEREDRGYGYQHSKKLSREGLSVPDGLYDAPGESREDRGHGYQRPQKLQQEQFPAEQVHVRKEKERHYEGKRARSRSRSSRRGGRRSRRHSYSRSSSRSRSRSYSASPPPHRRSHRRGSRDYSGRHHESKRVEARKDYPRRQRSRSQSSSRSRSSSRSSVSPSPPAKRYRRRSSDLSHSKTSHRHSSHSTSRRRSHSKDYPKEFTKDNPSNYSKSYPTDYQEKYAKEVPSKEYAKSYPPKGYVKDYPPKEYVKNYPPKEYVKDYLSKEYVKEYPKEYVKGYPKQYEKEYPKAYLSKDYRTNYPKEQPKGYNRRSRSPDRRHSHSREPEYHRSPSPDHHRSRSRDYGRDDEPWGAEIRFKGNPTPEKLRRPSRWQTRP